jgi:arginyl-tRNA synthetase
MQIEELRRGLKDAAQKMFNAELEPEITRPDEQFGDYATNAALQLAKKAAASPSQIAKQLVQELQNIPGIKAVSIAGPGFINFRLSDEALAKAAFSAIQLQKTHSGQGIVVEYSDPNPFKVLHVGHLYTSVVGDSIAKVLETAGANVHRVNFGGDVGLHVAKAMWAILKKLGGEYPEKLAEIPKEKRAMWLAEEYTTGSLAYGDDEKIDAEIKELNKRIYQIHEQQDKTSPLAQIYWQTRQWSYDYFDEFYSLLGTKFEKYYPESETTGPGLKIVKENIGKVFEESQGATVFKGELHNMHTRVFINSQGLPTYETKDVGLIFKKWEDYHFDKSIIITGNDIYEYMQVVLKAVEQIQPELAQKTIHITHGLVKMAGGQKMSSRKGNVILAVDVLDMAKEANKKVNQQENDEVAIGAVKYAFLKNRIGADIIFDPSESVSIEGNSGPYLQYAHARANSILTKAGAEPQAPENVEFDANERSLARKISEYPEIFEKAVSELMPHHISTYLYELAQTFNSFYEKSRIIGDERQNLRLKLAQTYQQVLKNGLGLLNIAAPDKM